jgi:phenylacetate-CoA ligase
MDVDSVITQFVDKDGNEVSAGERGEIIQTSLFNYAMPFIRYEVGDVGVPSDDECSCGRRLPLIKTVEGRTDSLVVLPDGRILSPRTLTVAVNMFDQYESIEQFRIVQKELNLLEILVETSNAAIDKRAMETSLVAHINRTLHLDEAKMTLRAKVVDNIPPGKSGKSMIVASELSRASALPTR